VSHQRRSTKVKAVEERVRRREAFLNLIKENPGIELDQAVGRYSYETGLSSTTVRRYLYELVNAGLVRIVEQLEKTDKNFPWDFARKTRLYPTQPTQPLKEDLR
jgi:DNA-binding transcriptional ArsR family regulator